MSRTYTYATTLSFGHEDDGTYAEFEVDVSYSVAWGSPETGRFGPPELYDPGCADEVEDIKLLTVDGKPRPWGMGYGFISDDEFADDVAEKFYGSERLMADLLAHAAEEAAADYEEAMEYRAEQRREDALFWSAQPSSHGGGE